MGVPLVIEQAEEIKELKEVLKTLQPLVNRIAQYETDFGSLYVLDLDHAQEVGLLVRMWTGTNSMRAVRDHLERLL